MLRKVQCPLLNRKRTALTGFVIMAVHDSYVHRRRFRNWPLAL